MVRVGWVGAQPCPGQELGLRALVPVALSGGASLGLLPPIRGDLDVPGERGHRGLRVMLSDFEKGFSP